jgi:hypothetical protein
MEEGWGDGEVGELGGEMGREVHLRRLRAVDSGCTGGPPVRRLFNQDSREWRRYVLR